MIYYYRYVNIPLLKIDSYDTIWVCLDKRVQRKVLDIIKKLISINVDFFMTSKIDIFEKDVYQENLQNIIFCYLSALTNIKFFNKIYEMNFDYIGNLTKFMNTYDCNGLLSDSIKKIFKNFINRKYYCYLRQQDIYYKVPSQKIREFFDTLERDIKINSLLNI